VLDYLETNPAFDAQSVGIEGVSRYGKAALVTRDLDLLDLMKDTTFRQQFPSLTILDPVAFLKLMAARESAEQPPPNADE